MSIIGCLDCYDGRANHCDGCNMYEISKNIQLYHNQKKQNVRS